MPIWQSDQIVHMGLITCFWYQCLVISGSEQSADFAVRVFEDPEVHTVCGARRHARWQLTPLHAMIAEGTFVYEAARVHDQPRIVGTSRDAGLAARTFAGVHQGDVGVFPVMTRPGRAG